MKKLCALFLCITMLLSLVCVAQAATTLNFVDTFDDLAVGTISATDVAAYSNAFDNCNYFRPNDAQISITADGYKGNAVTFVENGGTECYIDIRNGRDNAHFVPTADAPVYLTFKMKIVDSVNGTESFQIKGGGSDTLMLVAPNGGDYLWWHSGDSGRFSCVEGEWVDVQIKLSSDKTEIKVSDTHGHVNTFSRPYKYANIRITNAQKKVGSSFALDEISIIQGDGTDALNFISSNYGVEPKPEVTAIPVVDVNFADFASAGKTTQNYLKDTSKFTGIMMFTPDYYAHSVTGDCEGAGGTCPVVSNVVSGKAPCFYTIGADFDDNSKAFASMKVKIIDGTGANQGYFGFGKYVSGNSDMGNELHIRSGKFYGWNYWSDRTGYTYTPDIWYTIVVEYYSVDGVKKANLYIYNDEKELVYTQTPSGKDPTRTIDQARMTFRFDDTANMGIDDIKVIKAESTGEIDSQAFIAKEILGVTESASDSKANVHSTTPVIKASFDQIVSSGSTAKFTASGKDDVEATIKYTGSPLVEIAPVTPLDYDTNYTLDLSGIKGLNGQGLATGSTNALSVKTPAYSMGTMVVGTPVYDGTTATVTVNFTNSNLAKLDATVIGVLTKDNKLEYCSVKTLKEAPLGENTLTFTNLPEDRTGMTFKLLVWDNFTSLKPLFK